MEILSMCAYIHPTVKMAPGCKIGHFCVLERNVALGASVVVGNGVVIKEGTAIEEGVVIGDNSVIGKQPTPGPNSTVKYESDLPPVFIGRGTVIGALAVIYAGSRIGENCLVGDLASVRENCRVGHSNIIGRGVALENKVTTGSRVKIQSGAYITAGTAIEDDVFIAPMVTTANDNFMGRRRGNSGLKKAPRIKRGARVGAGAVLLPGIVLAGETFVAAGSVVTKNTNPARVVMGVPAREIRRVPVAEILVPGDIL